MKLSPVQQRFVLHWGEMGARWGLNRTVAQVHALLLISEKPLNAEELAETLAVARSNISNSIRELQGWGIVRLVHVLGDRRDHFECTKDPWEMFRAVLEERKRREVDPTLHLLRECVREIKREKGKDVYTGERLRELLEFMELTSSWYNQVVHLPPETIAKFMRVGDRIQKLIP